MPWKRTPCWLWLNNRWEIHHLKASQWLRRRLHQLLVSSTEEQEMHEPKREMGEEKRPWWILHAIQQAEYDLNVFFFVCVFLHFQSFKTTVVLTPRWIWSAVACARHSVPSHADWQHFWTVQVLRFFRRRAQVEKENKLQSFGERFSCHCHSA